MPYIRTPDGKITVVVPQEPVDIIKELLDQKDSYLSQQADCQAEKLTIQTEAANALASQLAQNQAKEDALANYIADIDAQLAELSDIGVTVEEGSKGELTVLDAETNNRATITTEPVEVPVELPVEETPA